MQTSNLKIGTILKSPTQEYRIDDILGAGSFGITYLATSKVKYGNVSFNVRFAIKEHFMESCFRDDDGIFVHCTPTSQKNVEQSRKDFLNEARRLQEICQYSPNIVHVNEAFEANGTAYYVMEYLDGGSPKKMEEESAVRLIQQIAEAVLVLHKNKLLHLDIKPDNIVLKTSDDGTSYPVLIDFGITKHFDEKGNPTSSPNAKGISQGYAPVEQNDVIREFAPTLDIYALGATLLYLLTGKNPPSSVTLIDPNQRTLQGLIPSNTSKSTRRAILNAMNPNENDRTQNVSSFLKDLGSTIKQTDNKNVGGKTKTEPINNKKTHTEPLKKKANKGTNKSQEEKDPPKWNASYWAVFTTFALSLIGFWFFDSNLLITGIWCLLGLIADFTLCHYIGKWTNKKVGLLFSISFLLFLVACVFVHNMTAVYVVLSEFAIMTTMLIVLTVDKNYMRWIASIAFLGATAFFGYVWYSNNVLHTISKSEDDTSDISTELNSESQEDVYETKSINIDGHECVDMGLSVNWAAYNLGADHFEGSSAVLGDFYAYGNLTPTDSASNVRVKDARTMFKDLSYLQKNNIVDSNNILTSKFDAVTSQWGQKWRTPTIEELKELFSNCKRVPGQVDGRNGIWLTGPNGVSIFLPAQGHSLYQDGRDWNDRVAYYLSSTVNNSNNTQCYGIYFEDNVYHVFCPSRNMGLLIRPVSDK